MTLTPSANRPSGKSSNQFIDLLMSRFHVADRRNRINQRISGQTNQPTHQADRPSVHLRWALQQMKLRGWNSKDWGALFDDDGKLGTGPICLLEACGAGADAPGAFSYESPEQFYLRSAFVALGQEVPLYLSSWNDEQETFEPIETVLLKAIELAEADEAAGVKPWVEMTEGQFAKRFGITSDRLHAERIKQEAETAS